MTNIKELSEALDDINKKLIQFQKEIDNLESWKEAKNQLYLNHPHKHGEVMVLQMEMRTYLEVIDNMIKVREKQIEKIKSRIYVQDETYELG